MNPNKEAVTSAADTALRIAQCLQLPDQYPIWCIVRKLKNIKLDYAHGQRYHNIRRPQQIIKDLRPFIKFCGRLNANAPANLSLRLSRRLNAVDEQGVNLMIWYLAEYRWPNRKRHEITDQMREELYQVHANDPLSWRKAAEDTLAGMETRNWLGRGQTRRDRGSALDQTFIFIGLYYKHLTGRTPVVGSDGPDSVPYGRFIEFAILCMNYIGHPNTTPHAVRERLRRVRSEAGW